MKKHPSHFKVHESLVAKMSDTEVKVLYEGPVRDLCPLAPLNVNTMATLSLFGIGFDRTVGRLGPVFEISCFLFKEKSKLIFLTSKKYA